MVALFKFYFNLSNIVLIFEITYFYFGFKHYVRTTSLFCPKSFILSSFSIFDDNFTLCSKWLIQLHNQIPRIFPSKLCVGKLAFMAFLEEFIYWKILLFLNLEKNEAIIYFHYKILNCMPSTFIFHIKASNFVFTNNLVPKYWRLYF